MPPKYPYKSPAEFDGEVSSFYISLKGNLGAAT